MSSNEKEMLLEALEQACIRLLDEGCGIDPKVENVLLHFGINLEEIYFKEVEDEILQSARN